MACGSSSRIKPRRRKPSHSGKRSANAQGQRPHGPPSFFPNHLNAVGAQLARFFHLGSADRLRYWLGTVGRFASVQVVMQALNAVTGFLILRQLTKADYALYTIVNTMQGTMSVLADAGIGVALSAVGGKVWQDRRRMGELVNTALRTRWRMAGVVGVVISPLLAWMLWRNGAGAGYGAALMAAVLVGLYFQLSQDVYIIVPRLHSQMQRVMRNNLFVALVRLALTAALLSVFFNACVAVAMAAVVAAYQNRKMAGLVGRVRRPRRPHQPLRPEAEIARKIRHLMPSAIFYCLEGQLLILLISFTGRSDHVADVGALGRLAVIFDLFGSLLVNLALPAFTRCHDPALLKKRYVQILGGYLCLGRGDDRLRRVRARARAVAARQEIRRAALRTDPHRRRRVHRPARRDHVVHERRPGLGPLQLGRNPHPPDVPGRPAHVHRHLHGARRAVLHDVLATLAPAL